MSESSGFSPLTPESDSNLSFASGLALQPAPAAHVTCTTSDRRLSSARALVPHVTLQVTTASSPQSVAGPCSSGGGPAGKAYYVPSRPKPGRKPATDEPASKRKAQNRESQRNFRARKMQKMLEVQEDLKKARAAHEEEDSKRMNEIAALHARIRELESVVQTHANDMQALRDEYATMEAHRNYWHDEYDRLWEVQQTMAHQQPQDHTAVVNGSDFANGQYSQRHHYETPVENSISDANAYGTPNTDILDGCGGCKPNGECACITDIANQVTMEDAFEPAVPLPSRATSRKEAETQSPVPFSELEIDFTAQFSTQQPRPDPRTSISFMTDNEHESCGFCTDVSNCACRATSLQVGIVDDDTPAILADIKPVTRVLQGPGSCDDCQANPKQAAWCQRISKLRSEATPSTSRRGSNASSSSRTSIVKPLRRDSNMSTSSRTSDMSDSRMNNSLKTLEPRVDSGIGTNDNRALRSIGCSEAFKLLDGRVPMDSDRMDWVANLKPVLHDARRDTFTMEPRLYSAMELDAAGIITTLGNSRQTLQPRPSDGKNADIVRLAEEFRRSSHSPRTAPGDHKLPGIESMHMEM